MTKINVSIGFKYAQKLEKVISFCFFDYRIAISFVAFKKELEIKRVDRQPDKEKNNEQK